MTLLLATNNAGKVREFHRLMPEVDLLVPSDLGLQLSYEENGETFLENAVGKARQLYRKGGIATLAEDSGLVVPALGGAPGVRSARYGGNISQKQRNFLLINSLANAADRSAMFVCCITVILAEYRLLIVQETVQGKIITEPKGSGGFGYDPIFQSLGNDKTFAQLSEDNKNEISHRGRALRRFQELLLQS